MNSKLNGAFACVLVSNALAATATASSRAKTHKEIGSVVEVRVTRITIIKKGEELRQGQPGCGKNSFALHLL